MSGFYGSGMGRRRGRYALFSALLVSAALVAPAEATTATFNTPGQHMYVVPAGVTEIEVTAIGGNGSTTVIPGYGGRGALIRSRLSVEPGETYYAVVGSDANGTTPGANGGGAVATPRTCLRTPAAGGGASDLRTLSLSAPGSADSRVLVAGGGGGAGGYGTEVSSAGTDVPQGGAGGHRGNGGRGPVGTDSPGPRGPGSRNGTPSDAGERTGTATTGGQGGDSTTPDGGCGGGGGGGYGGGGGGAGSAGTAGGSGGGGGGSLDPQGDPFGRTAPLAAVPSVTIDDSPPLETGAMRIDPHVYVSIRNIFNNCPDSCTWCGLPERDDAQDACSTAALTAGNGWDAGYLSQQNWASDGLQRPVRGQAGMGINPATPQRADPGEPFTLGELAHFNIAIRGPSPTSLGLGGRVTVQLPAGDPIVLPIGLHTYTSGDYPAVLLDFLETDNTPPCDPQIQLTATPCDDRFRIVPDGLEPPPTTVRGVTFELTHLGFKDSSGTYGAPLITEEGGLTTGNFYAEIEASTSPTTTGLDVGEGPTLRATVAPAPWTGDGTVEFQADGQPIPGCHEVQADPETGVAACAPADLESGTYSVSAAYSGGVGFGASASEAVELVVPSPLARLTVKRVKLGKALRRGLVVKVSGAEAGRLKLVAKRGGKQVAKGATQIGESGEGRVRLAFNRAAKRKFADARRLRLRISGGGGAVKVTLKR